MVSRWLLSHLEEPGSCPTSFHWFPPLPAFPSRQINETDAKTCRFSWITSTNKMYSTQRVGNMSYLCPYMVTGPVNQCTKLSLSIYMAYTHYCVRESRTSPLKRYVIFFSSKLVSCCHTRRSIRIQGWNLIIPKDSTQKQKETDSIPISDASMQICQIQQCFRNAK